MLGSEGVRCGFGDGLPFSDVLRCGNCGGCGKGIFAESVEGSKRQKLEVGSCTVAPETEKAKGLV